MKTQRLPAEALNHITRLTDRATELQKLLHDKTYELNRANGELRIVREELKIENALLELERLKPDLVGMASEALKNLLRNPFSLGARRAARILLDRAAETDDGRS